MCINIPGIYIVHSSHVHCIFPFTVQIPPIKLRLEDKSALKEENGIPNMAITTVNTTEDSFSATRESLEILEIHWIVLQMMNKNMSARLRIIGTAPLYKKR